MRARRAAGRKVSGVRNEMSARPGMKGVVFACISICVMAMRAKSCSCCCFGHTAIQAVFDDMNKGHKSLCDQKQQVKKVCVVQG